MHELLIIFFRDLLLFKNAVISSYRRAPVKFCGVVLFLLLITIGIYAAHCFGLYFLVSLGGVGALVIRKLIYILFFMLFWMVAVSCGALFYALSFKTADTDFLLCRPIKFETIAAYKFLQSVILSSWIPVAGILFFIGAYCFAGGVSFTLALASIVYTMPFLLISCWLGAVVCLAVVRFFNVKKFFTIIGVALLAFLLFHRPAPEPKHHGVFYFITEDTLFLDTARLWYMPFAWAPRGLEYFEDKRYFLATVYLFDLWALAGLCFCSTVFCGELFVKNYNRVHSVARARLSGRDVLGVIFSGVTFLPRRFKAFLIKDIRFFTREPGLWLQAMVFFGILFLYFLNFRRLSFDDLPLLWKNLIIFLNTFSILSVVGGLGVRFVFPQWSLEGKNFWLLRLSPVRLSEVFWEKFITWVLAFWATAAVLVYFSGHMLKLSGVWAGVTTYITAVSVLCLIALSLGLGAYFADLKEEHYLEAVESLGGFITLVANFAYIFLTIVIFGGLGHWHAIGKLHDFSLLKTALIVWTAFSLVAGFVVVWLGLRKLEAKEY